MTDENYTKKDIERGVKKILKPVFLVLFVFVRMADSFYVVENDLRMGLCGARKLWLLYSE